MKSLAHWLRVLRCNFGFGDHVKSIARLSRTATACLALNAEHEMVLNTIVLSISLLYAIQNVIWIHNLLHSSPNKRDT